MTYLKEQDFENALVEYLSNNGENEVLERPTEAELVENWKKFLFVRNRESERLGDYPLTDGETEQLLTQIRRLKTPLDANEWINGQTVSVVRDNPDDKLHCGKTISLTIYSPWHIAGGKSRYQIARQPRFSTDSPLLGERRGDLTLLINGLPLIHIELKGSGVSIDKACNQIEIYSREGVFKGFFGLTQIFVAMTPEETVYFANPGASGKFNPNFYFHWADTQNRRVDDWHEIARRFLSPPLAHQLVGLYSVADRKDGALKVMRSYQFYAAQSVWGKVAKHDWNSGKQEGGYVWHTTGSGKTLTSFKCAQLIRNSKKADKADKVVFLTDRIELGTQAFENYQNFAKGDEAVQKTENSYVLEEKLASDNPNDALIVTSIQKASEVSKKFSLASGLPEKIRRKKIVFIVDEAHRSTFGEFMINIKNTFRKALFFGFTGTPIQDENAKKDLTTDAIFGPNLHRYNIAEGIIDRNVLGFDVYKVSTFEEAKVRECVALEQAKAKTVEEAQNDPKKAEIFYRYLYEVPMAGYKDENGKYVKGIEDFLSTEQFETEEHRNAVVRDILEKQPTLSRNGKFHGIFATSSITDAIAYFRKIKAAKPELNVACLFDPPSVSDCDDVGSGEYKEEGLLEILEDYNRRFDRSFTVPTHAAYKRDVAARLAHVKPYAYVENDPKQRLDLLIVVNQMLTGYDSKWVSALYLDKSLSYENVIQAFSRTNRLFGSDKRFGTIRYYRKPHTMEQNVKKAVELYSGDVPTGLFVDKLEKHIELANGVFRELKCLFRAENIENFGRLPETKAARGEFAKLYRKFQEFVDAARIQGFFWDGSDDSCDKPRAIFTEDDCRSLAMRYKELHDGNTGNGRLSSGSTYELYGYLAEIATGKFDASYMNELFDKYLKIREQSDEAKRVLEDLRRQFTKLSEVQQQYASIILNDVEFGKIKLQPGKSFSDYLAEYQVEAEQKRITKFAQTFGLDEALLREIMRIGKGKIDEYGRLGKLKESADFDSVKRFFEKREGKKFTKIIINAKFDAFLRRFIEEEGVDL